MDRSRTSRVRIGMSMPAWLPEALHMPVRAALGIMIGVAFGAYAVALAISADRVLSGAGDPALNIGHLVGLLAGAWVMRHALVRWGGNDDTDL